MNDDRDPLTHLLDGLAPPPPPARLESRVLRAAREAMERDRSRDGWARAWESPVWRLAWAAALVDADRRPRRPVAAIPGRPRAWLDHPSLRRRPPPAASWPRWAACSAWTSTRDRSSGSCTSSRRRPPSRAGRTPEARSTRRRDHERHEERAHVVAGRRGRRGGRRAGRAPGHPVARPRDPSGHRCCGAPATRGRRPAAPRRSAGEPRGSLLGMPGGRGLAAALPDRPRRPRPARHRYRQRRGVLQGLREAERVEVPRGDGRHGAPGRRSSRARQGAARGRPPAARGRAVVRPGDDALLPGVLQGRRVVHPAPQPHRPAEPRPLLGGPRDVRRRPGAGHGGLPSRHPARPAPPPGGRDRHRRPRRPGLHPRRGAGDLRHGGEARATAGSPWPRRSCWASTRRSVS